MVKKSQATKIEDMSVTTETGEKVLLWKATRELSAEEHEQLASKLQLEQEHAGIKIVLVPLSVEVELSTEPAAEPAADSTDAPDQGGDNQ